MVIAVELLKVALSTGLVMVTLGGVFAALTVIVEVALLAVVIRYAWTWPATESRSASVPIFSAAQPVGAADLRRQRAEMPSS